MKSILILFLFMSISSISMGRTIWREKPTVISLAVKIDMSGKPIWDKEGNRSIKQKPTVSLNSNNIFIYPYAHYENLHIIIRNQFEDMVYSETNTLYPYQEHILPINLPQGNYVIELYNKDYAWYGFFQIEE